MTVMIRIWCKQWPLATYNTMLPCFNSNGSMWCTFNSYTNMYLLPSYAWTFLFDLGHCWTFLHLLYNLHSTGDYDVFINLIQFPLIESVQSCIIITYQWTPSNLDSWNVATSVFRPLWRIPNRLLQYKFNTSFPVTPTDQDTLIGPKVGRIRGSPLIYSVHNRVSHYCYS